MGLPEIIVEFRTAGATALRRSSHGSAAIIVAGTGADLSFTALSLTRMLGSSVTIASDVGDGRVGAAKQLKIESAQPRIIENEQGLLVNFVILGSYVQDDHDHAPAVTAWQEVTDGN